MTHHHPTGPRSVWSTTIIPLLWLLACCIIIGLALGATVGRAGATPDTTSSAGEAYAEHNAISVCLTLDTRPTILGLIGVLQAVETVGHLSPDQAGQAVALSVTWVCPIHQPLLRAFVNAYGPQPVVPGVSV